MKENTNKTPKKRRLKLLACEIFYRELTRVLSDSPNIIDAEFLRKGLHDVGTEKMAATLQEAVNDCNKYVYDYILLGYGRCNNGVVGLHANEIPLVIPRAHDCITLFFGSRSAYDRFFEEHPGTYFRTTGWMERDGYDDDSLMHQMGMEMPYEQMVEKYGKENADYLRESLGGWQQEYKALAYIELGYAVDQAYIEQARREAAEKGWEFIKLQGNMRLFAQLVAGNWPEEDFLIVNPGEYVATDDTGGIITAIKD